jgi:hypothetical protein
MGRRERGRHQERSTPGRALTLTLALALATGCERDEVARCQDLARLIQAKQVNAEVACSRDTQCLVAEIGPGGFHAVRPLAPDPEFEATVGVFERSCADAQSVRRLNIFEARCLPRDDDPQYGRCQLVYEGAVVPPSQAQAVLASYCECADTTECAPGLLCGGACLCETPCRAGCGRASACSGWESLGIGTTRDACEETCALNEDEERMLTLMRCLAEAPTCVDASTCVAQDKP